MFRVVLRIFLLVKEFSFTEQHWQARLLGAENAGGFMRNLGGHHISGTIVLAHLQNVKNSAGV